LALWTLKSVYGYSTFVIFENPHRPKVKTLHRHDIYGQVSLDNEHRSSGCLSLLEDVATTSVQDSVDTTDGVFGALKFETDI